MTARSVAPPLGVEMLLGISLVSFATATVIGRLVATGKIVGADKRARRWVRRHNLAALSAAADAATWFGEPVVHLPLALLASAMIARDVAEREPRRPRRMHRRRNLLGYYGRTLGPASSPSVASLAAFVAHRGIKALFKRRRPPGAWLHGKTEPSFPSGHATATAAVAGAVAYALARQGCLRAAVAIPVGIAVPLAVGASRVYLDKHWASDVGAGWCIGLGFAGLAALLFDATSPPPPARRS